MRSRFTFLTCPHFLHKRIRLPQDGTSPAAKRIRIHLHYRPLSIRLWKLALQLYSWEATSSMVIYRTVPIAPHPTGPSAPHTASHPPQASRCRPPATGHPHPPGQLPQASDHQASQTMPPQASPCRPRPAMPPQASHAAPGQPCRPRPPARGGPTIHDPSTSGTNVSSRVGPPLAGGLGGMAGLRPSGHPQGVALLYTIHPQVARTCRLE